jgi:hypothetical protein
MLKVSVKNKLSQQITNQAQFDTQDQVDSWISSQEEVQAFGKPEHQKEITPAVVHPDTGEIAEEAEYETVPAEYTIEVEDITLQLETETRILARVLKGNNSRNACVAVINYISGYNQERDYTQEQVGTMVQEFGPILYTLNLENRADTAKEMVQNIVPDGDVVTEEMKSDILKIFNDHNIS